MNFQWKKLMRNQEGIDTEGDKRVRWRSLEDWKRFRDASILPHKSDSVMPEVQEESPQTYLDPIEEDNVRPSGKPWTLRSRLENVPGRSRTSSRLIKAWSIGFFWICLSHLENRRLQVLLDTCLINFIFRAISLRSTCGSPRTLSSIFWFFPSSWKYMSHFIRFQNL